MGSAVTLIDEPARVFQMWAYSVGMGRLLLRSTKTGNFPTRIDVLFQNVKAMQVPTVFDGLVVTEADDEFAARIETETGLLRDDNRFFCLETAHRVGYIVAGVMVREEDGGEYFGPSALWPELR
jgi:hypothetical protein